jgi:putative membrane protein
MYWYGHMSAAGWILSVLWTLIIIALVVAGIMWLISALSSRHNRGPSAEASRPSAREILDRRLASGELNVEQYKQLRDTIGDAAPPAGGTGPPRPASAPG